MLGRMDGQRILRETSLYKTPFSRDRWVVFVYIMFYHFKQWFLRNDIIGHNNWKHFSKTIKAKIIWPN